VTCTASRTFAVLAILVGIAPSACTGVQSSLAPSGRDAESIASLFWWMAAAALIVWIGVVALAFYYAWRPSTTPDRRRDRLLIIGGGVVLPTISVTVLLIFGLAMMPRTVARAPEGSLQIQVIGEQWWWRVHYLRRGVRASGYGRQPDVMVTLANEVRLPVGEPVQFRLESDT
jgi:cytochrome c oxidase subunit 2